MTQGGKIDARFDRWVDEWKMALSGILLATRDPKFDVTVVITFAIFGTLMNLLSSSTAALNLFWATNFTGKLSIIKDSFLAIFGVGRNFWDWILLFIITLLQSVLIGLVVLVWRKKRRDRYNDREQKDTTEPKRATNQKRVADQDISSQNADNLQSAGLVAGLAVLGSGCPTCGTTLLMPLIGTIFSSGGYVLAGTISGILTVAAVWLALFTLRRIGKQVYAMIKSEDFMKHHKEKEQNGRLPEK